ncbi:MAG: HEAT repeat domain-containing protein [Myxococcota bacterium]
MLLVPAVVAAAAITAHVEGGALIVTSGGAVLAREAIEPASGRPTGRPAALGIETASHAIDGREIFHVRAPLGGGAAQELIFRVDPGPRLLLLHRARTGPQPPDLESTLHLEVSTSGIHAYRTEVGASRCDGRADRLDHRALDLARGGWVGVPAAPIPIAADALRMRATALGAETGLLAASVEERSGDSRTLRLPAAAEVTAVEFRGLHGLRAVSLLMTGSPEIVVSFPSREENVAARLTAPARTACVTLVARDGRAPIAWPRLALRTIYDEADGEARIDAALADSRAAETARLLVSTPRGFALLRGRLGRLPASPRTAIEDAIAARLTGEQRAAVASDLIACLGEGTRARRAACAGLLAREGRYRAEARAALDRAPPPTPAREADLLLALRLMGDATGAAARLGADRPFEVRYRALQAVARAPATLGDALTTLLDDPDEVIRRLAVEAIARAASDQRMPALRAALRDRDPAVRARAAEALAGGAGAEAASDLARVLRDDRWPFVRQRAAQALGAVCDASALSALRGASGTRADSWTRIQSLDARARCRDRSAIGAILALVESPDQDADLRVEAARLLARLSPTPPRSATHDPLRRMLGRALGDPDDARVAAALCALADDDTLRAAAEEPFPPEVRAAATAVLGQRTAR